MRPLIKHGRAEERIGVEPDRVFSLAYHDKTRHNFVLELDRATMTINARTLSAQADIRRKNFKRKILAYYNAWQQKLHTQLWGFDNFRVLSIVPTDAWIANIIKRAQRPVTAGHATGMFLYSTPERIARHGILGPAWVSSEDENVSLSKRR